MFARSMRQSTGLLAWGTLSRMALVIYSCWMVTIWWNPSISMICIIVYKLVVCNTYLHGMLHFGGFKSFFPQGNVTFVAPQAQAKVSVTGQG
jgi:hypothetical protein